MQRLFRRRNRPLRGREPARWMFHEVVLIIVSLALIVFPLYAEVYRWLNPTVVPAAPALQRVTFTPTTPQPTVPPPPPTNTPVGATATNTPVGATATNTPVGATATNTPVGATPTNTAIGATPTATQIVATATNTAGPPTPTNTQVIGVPPLSLSKVASDSEVDPGQQFSYSISVFSSSEAPRQVDVVDTINITQLEFVGASASSGSCALEGADVNCTVTARNNAPATIVITVRVRPGATPGASIENTALAQDDRSNTAASDRVVVVISEQLPPPPTSTTGPTPTDGLPPTEPPTPTEGPSPTASLVPTDGPSPTTGPTTPPGNTPEPRTPRPPDQEATDTPQPKPTTPPQPPLPPTSAPAPAPTQPRPGVRRTQVPAPAQPGAPRAGTPAATATPGPTSTPTPPPPEAGVFFRMASDWGSVFPGQEVEYTIVVRNTRTSGALREIVISSALPANLEVLGDRADRGDPAVTGNQLTLRLDALQPGEGVEIGIKTRVKETVASGTQIVSQAQLNFAGLSLPIYSNMVTVLVVDAAQLQATGTLTPTATTGAITATASLSPTVGATTTATPTLTVAPTSAPTATARATAAPAAGPGAAPLPHTSTGAPILGFALLGMTLMVRTVRLHRSQTRL